MQIMAKPNVWRADIHLTDRIIVRLTFYRLITGIQDSLFLSLSLLSLCLSLSVCLFSALRVNLRACRREGCPADNTALCAACSSVHLTSSALVSTESHMSASPNIRLSIAHSVCYLLTALLFCLFALIHSIQHIFTP